MRRTMKAGLSLFRIRAAEALQYRVAALSGATVSTFWVLIEVAVVTVFFAYGNVGAGGSINGMGLTQAVSYLWVGQWIFMIAIPAVTSDTLNKINSGDIGIDLCRPLDLYWHWFANLAASKVSGLLMRGALVLLCGVIISLIGFRNVGLGLPASPLHLALFLLSLFGAFVFSASFGMFVTTIRMNVRWGDGPMHLVALTGQILSGGYLPLQIWPDFMQTFLRLQPFASSLDTPARLYTGSVSIHESLLSMLLQLFWIAAFIALGRAIMKRRIKTVVVQGG